MTDSDDFAEFEDAIFKKEKAPRPGRMCWGCSLVEAEGVRFDKICSICDQIDAIPACFCSYDCYKKSWPKHKAWHEYHKNEQKDFLATPGPNGRSTGEWERRSDYDALIAQSANAIWASKFAIARKLLRKAQKMDSRRPEAYFDLGYCFDLSGHWRESLFYYEEATHRWALAGLTGYVGDVRFEDGKGGTHYPTEQWAWCVYNLFNNFRTTEGNDVMKPTWYSRDASLKRVTKLALDTLKEDDTSSTRVIQRMSLMRGLILSGTVSNGKFHHTYTPPDDRTPDDLEEAANCFKVFAQSGEDKSAIYEAQSVVLMDTSRSRAQFIAEAQEEITAFIEPEIAPGSWVCVLGLVSPTGVAMNGKLGLVADNTNIQGRIPVQVDGFPGTKLIKQQNTFQLPILDNSLALIACLKADIQWIYMRGMLSTFKSQGIIPSRGSVGVDFWWVVSILVGILAAVCFWACCGGY